MSMEHLVIRNIWLPVLLIAYGAASLFHHVHNAEFLDEYPNMPAWLSPARVYAAWVAVTAIGVVGYFLIRSGYQVVGLAVLCVYAAFGLGGLAHYTLAPLSSHTLTMRFTIWLEVATAVSLLIIVSGLIFSRVRGPMESRERKS